MKLWPLISALRNREGHPCNLHGKPEYPDQRKLNEVQPVACIGRFVDEYIGWLEGVDDPEER